MEQSPYTDFPRERKLDSLLAIVLWALSYLLGSISSAILVCRLFRLPDPRSTGSKNPGATNVYRVGTPAAAVLTLVGDVGKGIIPVIVARQLHLPESVAAFCGFCAFLGHLYPLYFDFEGGKGVATALGVLAALHLPSMLAVASIWLIVGIATHISSLASMVSFFLAPWIVLFSHPELFYPMVILSLLLLFRHRQNMLGLLKGNELALRRNTTQNKD